MKKTLLLTLCCALTLISTAQLSVTLFPKNPSCANPCGGSISTVVTGGSGSQTYTWSNGTTASSVVGLCPGTYTLTVFDQAHCNATDGAECSVTATATIVGTGTPISCSITSVPNGDINSTGGDPNTLYLGYGPASTHLSVSATGTAPFTYSWAPATGLSCTNCASPVFTPTAQGLYTFTVTVSDASRCAAPSTCTITICVLDIRASSTAGAGTPNDKKVYVCHIPPGNPANPQTICISVNAVPAHVPLHGGDHLGRCDQRCGSNKTDDDKAPELITDENNGLNILIYPNPFVSSFHLSVESNSTEPYNVKLYDVTGKIVDEQMGIDPSKDIKLGNSLSKGIYFAHVQQGNTMRVIRVVAN